MSSPALDPVRASLTQRAGGWLRNPIRRDRVTCCVCATPAVGYARCYPCNGQRAEAGAQLADSVASMTYAVAGQQSAYVMRGYKAPKPLREHREYVFMLCLVGLVEHRACAGELVRADVTHWAAVPSLPAKPGEHALQSIVARIMRMSEVPLIAARSAPKARSLNADHYRAGVPVGGRSHVLLVDDTWVSGGHAQSAVLALRAAGAERVSVLTVARWLDPERSDTARFVREDLTADYDPVICPWTGSGCP